MAGCASGASTNAVKISLVESVLRRLDGVVDESTLVHTWIDLSGHEVLLQLAVLVHPASADGPRPERLL